MVMKLTLIQALKKSDISTNTTSTIEQESESEFL